MIESIEKKELKGINKATEQLHVAVQYLSMAGEFLGERKEDGSHANLGWLTVKEKFISRPFGNNNDFILELSPALMQITFANTKSTKADSLALRGITQGEGEKWIIEKLKENKIEGAKDYKIKLPYELPAYADFEGKKFKRSPKKAFIGFAKLRTWGDYFINMHKANFELAGPSRTWPHHFDHAAYIPLERSKNKVVTKSISLGLAIHDGIINEPYFYISGWEKNRELDLSKMSDLSSGHWRNDDFKGAVLPALHLADDPNFQNKIDTYFQDSIAQLLELLKYKS